MLLPRFLGRQPTGGGGGVGLRFDYPTSLDNLELWLHSYDFDGLANNTAVGESAIRPWVDHSGQSQGAARDGVQGTAARRPVVKTTGGFEAPNGVQTVSFISQTGTPIGPNPFKQLASANPTGVGNPWDVLTRGHTFVFAGRIYNMGTQGALWSDLLDNRSVYYPRGGPLGTEAQSYIRTQAGTFRRISQSTIFSSSPLPWGLMVLQFVPPVNTNGTIIYQRWSSSEGWVQFVPDATAQWSTAGTTGWKLSGNASANIAQNMDLGSVLWYSDVLTQAELDFLALWSLIYFGGE